MIGELHVAPMARGFHKPGDVENRLGYSVKSCAKTGLNFCWEKACARKQPR